jgi:polysaccharide deacetylase family protein (PEP-CTERM system associated)
MNILTFDIEEWFHILNNVSTKTENEWNTYESRIYANTDRILNLLDNYKTRATFFCLGWIAKKYPDIIRRIADLHYEIGSHTMTHQLIYDQSRREFSNDLERSIKTLEDIVGKKVRCFRAPGFSLREDTKWAFDSLISQGIEIDCSIIPGLHSHGGFLSYGRSGPSIIQYEGSHIKEMPVNCKNFFGLPVAYSGGGYFRLFPYVFIKRWTKKSDYVVVYLHPRDFDPGQPMIPSLSLMRKFKSYVGLSKTFSKFERYLNDFDFIDVAEADSLISWEKNPITVLCAPSILSEIRNRGVSAVRNTSESRPVAALSSRGGS